jgi:hypothetical protein
MPVSGRVCLQALGACTPDFYANFILFWYFLVHSAELTPWDPFGIWGRGDNGVLKTPESCSACCILRLRGTYRPNIGTLFGA